MRKWCTDIIAIDPIDGKLRKWGGPNIDAPTEELAKQFCQNNGLGYCKVNGELVAEIPTMSDGITPDWENRVDYDKINAN